LRRPNLRSVVFKDQAAITRILMNRQSDENIHCYGKSNVSV
jgi:hypothetical protein